MNAFFATKFCNLRTSCDVEEKIHFILSSLQSGVFNGAEVIAKYLCLALVACFISQL